MGLRNRRRRISSTYCVGGVVYFGSWDGKEYAVDSKTGAKIWDYDCGNPSRSGAAYGDGVLFFGDLGGSLHAIDAKTGALKWKVKVDTHKETVATAVANLPQRARVYRSGVPRRRRDPEVRSKVRVLHIPRRSCAFDAKTGAQVWRWYTIPETPTDQGKDKKGVTIMGPAGGAVWSTVTVHPRYESAIRHHGNQYTPPASKFPNAIVALELSTGRPSGRIKRPRATYGRLAARISPSAAISMWTSARRRWFSKDPVESPQSARDKRAAGFTRSIQKTASFCGRPRWVRAASLAGSSLAMRRTASASTPRYQIFQGKVGIRARWRYGKILWQTKSPDGGSNFGPITVTGTGDNRLVFAGSNKNFIRAFDAKDGKILWEFDTGGAVGGGPTVVDGVVYVGSGYQFLGGQTEQKTLCVFD